MSPNHYVSQIDGSLARRSDGLVIRYKYAGHIRNISTGVDLRASLRAGSSTDLGGYVIAYLCSDGGTLCPDCVRSNLREVIYAIRTRIPNGWRVVGLYHSGECDGDAACDHCGKTIFDNNEPTDDELTEFATLNGYKP